MKRLAAVVVALAMIAGAWFLRAGRDGEDGTGGSGGNTSEELRLRCASELKDACESIVAENEDIVLRVEDPGTTSDLLVELDAGEDPGFDVWIVDGPWATITADNRAFSGASGAVLGEPGEVLARSPAVLVVQQGRSDELTDACGGTITWSCVGEQPAGLSVGIPTPERGDGLVVLAEATASFLGTTDYSANDFAEPGFDGWFDRLTELSAATRLGDQSPLARALVAPGTFNVVGALESQSSTLLRDRGGWQATYPDPMVIADVQLVPRAGLEAGDALDRLDAEAVRAALGDEGWRIDGAAPAGTSDAPALPDSANLPAPGVLQQLRSMW